MQRCPQCGYDLRELSPREVEIRDRLIKGMTAKEIAEDLAISHKTVDVHRSAIYRKLGVHSQLGLIRRFHLGETVPENYLPTDQPRDRRQPLNHPWRKDEEAIAQKSKA